MVFTFSGRHTLFATKQVTSLEGRLGENILPLPPETTSNLESKPLITQVSFNIPTGVETLTLPPYPAPIVYSPQEAPPIEVRIQGIWNSALHSLLTSFNFDTYPPLWDLFVYIIPNEGGFLFPLSIPRSATLTFSEGGEPLRLELGFTTSYAVILPPESANPPQPYAGEQPPQVVNNIRSVLTLSNNPITHPRKVISFSLSANNQLTPFHPMPVDVWEASTTQRRAPRLFALGYTTVDARLRTYGQPLVSPSEVNGVVLQCEIDCYNKEMDEVLLSFLLQGIITSSGTTIDINGAIIWDVALSAFGSTTTPPIVWG